MDMSCRCHASLQLWYSICSAALKSTSCSLAAIGAIPAPWGLWSSSTASARWCCIMFAKHLACRVWQLSHIAWFWCSSSAQQQPRLQLWATIQFSWQLCIWAQLPFQCVWVKRVSQLWPAVRVISAFSHCPDCISLSTWGPWCDTLWAGQQT